MGGVIPRCQKCGAEVSVSVGLPVSVFFDKGDDEACVATVAVDTTELADDFYVNCECDGAPQAELTDEDADRLVLLLRAVGRRCAPECDVVVARDDLVEEAR